MRSHFKNIILVLFLCIGALHTQAQTDYSINKLIDRLFDKLIQKQYFDLRKIYESNERKLPSSYSLFFGAYIDAAFNNPKESNQKITELLKFPGGTISATDMLSILSIKQQNHIHLFEYKEAWQTGKFITSTYAEQLSSDITANYNNSEILWKTLLNTPKQVVVQDADVRLPLTTDQSGLYRVPISVNKQTDSFVFDTGANFSVMQRSMAQKLGLEIQDINFKTTASTGKTVESDLAVVPELQLGKLIIKHAVFIILNDEDLNFPSLNYEIKGIIGFPIIRALKEIQFSSNELFIPLTPEKHDYKNLALDGLSPIIELSCQDTPLAFHFDTGANKTSLYPRYYQKFQEKIDKKYTPERFNIASVGGHTESVGFVLKKLTLNSNDRQAKLKNVFLSIDKNTLNESVYGNIGQDFISQFKSYTINFESSYILFQ